jgi:GNAT superfamily N-acetyltransferase/hypoxanthine-guanine phosphoribosyltransferase
MEEVTQFSKDLASRLNKFQGSFPSVWCALGPSGVKIARFYLKNFPDDLRLKIKKIIVVDYNSKTGVTYKDPEDAEILRKTESVFLIDGSIHSGNSMLAVAKSIQELGVNNLTTYALILKRGSVFIPNFFGIIIPDHDRAFFLLNEGIPNNRIMSTGILRKLAEKDVSSPKTHLNCGLESIDAVTWSDLWYETNVRSLHVYVYEHKQQIRGIVSFFATDKNKLLIDTVGVDGDYAGTGIGASLGRWAETWARANKFQFIELWAKNDKAAWYEKKLGYSFHEPKKVLDLGKEKYSLMQRCAANQMMAAFCSKIG